MVECVREVVEKAACSGNCVIVGRGAPYFLRSREDAFHVFLYAPQEEKIRRMQRWGKNRQEAEELVSTLDRDRAAFIKHYFGEEWPNRHLYHLMVNTAMGDELVASTILECMKSVVRPEESMEVTR